MPLYPPLTALIFSLLRAVGDTRMMTGFCFFFIYKVYRIYRYLHSGGGDNFWLHLCYTYGMEKISTLFDTSIIPTKKPINSERAYVISQFVERLNVNAGKKYKIGDVWKVQKEVKPSLVAFKLSHLKMVDLYSFLSQCKDAKCGFEKCFWGALKVYKRPVYKSLAKKKV